MCINLVFKLVSENQQWPKTIDQIRETAPTAFPPVNKLDIVGIPADQPEKNQSKELLVSRLVAETGIKQLSDIDLELTPVSIVETRALPHKISGLKPSQAQVFFNQQESSESFDSFASAKQDKTTDVPPIIQVIGDDDSTPNETYKPVEADGVRKLSSIKKTATFNFKKNDNDIDQSVDLEKAMEPLPSEHHGVRRGTIYRSAAIAKFRMIKFNSTSTLFVEHTMINADLRESLR